jgi:hypothetical protein
MKTGRSEKCVKIWPRNLKERDRLGDMGINGNGNTNTNMADEEKWYGIHLGWDKFGGGLLLTRP